MKNKLHFKRSGFLVAMAVVANSGAVSIASAQDEERLQL